MKIAVVVGGWHWPLHFFRAMAKQSQPTDLFVVAHRSPELSVVRQEKVEILRDAPGRMGELDRELYSEYATCLQLRELGWEYLEAPNICGDWGFLNQWLEAHDWHQYELILNCHDDTYIRRDDLFEQLAGNWLMLSNGDQACEAPGYVRGSFEFFRRELLEMLGGKIDLGEITLTRVGQTDTPASRETLQPWNNTLVPLRRFLVENHLAERIARLSPYYRVSPWAIEGERGFLHKQAWAREWRMDEGLKAFPI